MQSRSQTWAALTAGGDFALETVAIIGTEGYTPVNAPKVSRGLFQGTLSVGSCVSATAEIVLRTTDTVPRAAEITLKCRVRDTADGSTVSEWLPVGTFYVAKRETDYSTGKVYLTCYDAMLKGRESYFEDGVITGTWPQSMTAVVADIASRMGVTVDSRTVIRTESRYVVPVPSELTILDVLGNIAGVHGGNWCITADGKLRLVPLITAPGASTQGTVPVTAILGRLATAGQMTISRVTMTTGEGEEAVTYTAGTDTGYEVTVQNNPCATQDICDDLLTTLSGIIYKPFTATNAIYDPAIELGDPVKYGDGLMYGVLIQADETLGASFRCTLSAPGDMEVENEYQYVSQLAKAAKTLQKGVDDARKVASNYLAQDSTGIMVADMTDGHRYTPSTVPAGVKNTFIDNDSFDVRDGQDVLASFGERSVLGSLRDMHIEIANDGLYLCSYSGKTLCKIGGVGYIDRQVTETLVFENTRQFFEYQFPANLLIGSSVNARFVGPLAEAQATFTAGTSFSGYNPYLGRVEYNADTGAVTAESFQTGELTVSYTVRVLDTCGLILGTLPDSLPNVGDRSVSVGDYNSIGHYASAGFGTCLKSGCEEQLTVGHANTAESRHALEIGNGLYLVNADPLPGDDDYERDETVTSNAFAVTWDGDVEIALDVNAASNTPDGRLNAAIARAGIGSEVIM